MMRKNIFRILLVFVLIAGITGIASADTNKFFTPVFNYNETDIDGVDYSHYNTTTEFSKTGGMPNDIFMVIVVVSLALLILSYKYNDELCGMLAVICSLITALASRSVDYVDGYGVTSQVAIQAATGKINVHEYVLMTHHILYPLDYITMLFVIVFILSVINIYRIYLLNKNIDGVNTR